MERERERGMYEYSKLGTTKKDVVVHWVVGECDDIAAVRQFLDGLRNGV